MSAPETIGPYRVVCELGRGGMGAVYEVRQPGFERRLALKLIFEACDATALQRFRREGQLLARFKHPNVVEVHDLGEMPDGSPYLVTDLVEGEELKARLDREGPFEPKRAAELSCTLASALAAVHGKGVLHRDIKPHNIIIRPDGSPVLLDFGLALGAGVERLTQTGQLMGTPAYMAPEQAEGAKDLDERADVYSLGATLFHLLAGRMPFHDATGLAQMIHSILTKPPRWPSEDQTIPADLEAICRKAMAKDSYERYASATALEQDLRRFLAGEAVEVPLPGGRRRVFVGALAFALLIVLGVAGAFLYPRGGAEQDAEDAERLGGQAWQERELRTSDDPAALRGWLEEFPDHPKGKAALRRLNRLARAARQEFDDLERDPLALVSAQRRWLSRFGDGVADAGRVRAELEALVGSFPRRVGILGQAPPTEEFLKLFSDPDSPPQKVGSLELRASHRGLWRRRGAAFLGPKMLVTFRYGAPLMVWDLTRSSAPELLRTLDPPPGVRPDQGALAVTADPRDGRFWVAYVRDAGGSYSDGVVAAYDPLTKDLKALDLDVPEGYRVDGEVLAYATGPDVLLVSTRERRYSPTRERQVDVCGYRAGERVMKLGPHPRHLRWGVVSDDGKRLLVGYGVGTDARDSYTDANAVVLWNVERPEEPPARILLNTFLPGVGAFTRDGKIAVGTNGHRLYVLEPRQRPKIMPEEAISARGSLGSFAGSLSVPGASHEGGLSGIVSYAGGARLMTASAADAVAEGVQHDPEKSELRFWECVEGKWAEVEPLPGRLKMDPLRVGLIASPDRKLVISTVEFDGDEADATKPAPFEVWAFEPSD